MIDIAGATVKQKIPAWSSLSWYWSCVQHVWCVEARHSSPVEVCRWIKHNSTQTRLEIAHEQISNCKQHRHLVTGQTFICGSNLTYPSSLLVFETFRCSVAISDNKFQIRRVRVQCITHVTKTWYFWCRVALYRKFWKSTEMSLAQNSPNLPIY